VDEWIAQELRGSLFPDKRLASRLRKLVEQLSSHLGQTIPMACQDWASTKAAYRFFASERVNEARILAGHFQATQARYAATRGPVLVLHDTTEISYQREDPSAVGVVGKTFTGAPGRLRLRTVCGILLHSSLVVTPEGLPLGLGAVRIWTRKKFKGCDRLKRKINATRVPIERKESVRWIRSLQASCEQLGAPTRLVHIGDRESDIYELFCAAKETGSHFLVRTCVDRLAGDGTITVSDEMQEVQVKGLHRIAVVDRRGRTTQAVLELRYRRVHVRPPIGKQDDYPHLDLTVLHASERGTPRNRDRIEWKLLTDLPIRTRLEAVEKLQWYAYRWRIETFHKILKSGCRVESLRLRTAERLASVIAVFCILAWRVFWMTMVHRSDPAAPAALAFTNSEMQLLDHLIPSTGRRATTPEIAPYLIKIARLGGYLARTRDGPPGNTVLWRGMARLTDIALGFTLRIEDVGNR
jgi:hypothetical protein